LILPYVLPYVSYFDLRCRVLLGRVGSSKDNEARLLFRSGDQTVRGGQLWEPPNKCGAGSQPGREPGTGGMGNISELVINLVSIDRREEAMRLNPFDFAQDRLQVRGRDTVLLTHGTQFMIPPAWGQAL
jgi:hypothetical protein